MDPPLDGALWARQRRSVDSDKVTEMAEIARLALASARPGDVDLWRAFFTLDARFGKIATRAREPMLAQLQLAWWRDELTKPAAERARGDAALDAATRFWAGSESALIALVDGWEAMLGEMSPNREALLAFARGRGQACADIARLVKPTDDRAGPEHAGEIWALAETAAGAPNEETRALAIELGSAIPSIPPMPRELRPMAVIAGLARRALARGGKPLMGDRLSPLVALRLGMLGR